MPFVHSIGVSVPDFFASNTYVKELVQTLSKPHWRTRFSELGRMIDTFFEKTGSVERVWRNADTLPKDHIKDAVEECLAKAPKDALQKISSVIFCGIDRGFVEPAHASALATQIGLDGVRAFDVADACLGWFTACQAATAFSTEEKPLALILSAEFPLDDPGLVLPDSFTIRNAKDFEWKSAALTLGEMATATLLDAASGVGNEIVRSENQHSQLCLVPIKKPWRFVDWNQNIELRDYECFLANGSKLTTAGFRPGLAVLQEYVECFGEPDLIIPHAFSSTVPKMVAERLGLENRLHNVFERVGNISTSSIPFALWTAMHERNLENSKIVGWVASAGMKHAVFDITWVGQEIAVRTAAT